MFLDEYIDIDESFNDSFENIKLALSNGKKKITLNRYNLLDIDEQCEIMPHVSRVYHKSINKTFKLVNVCSELLYVLKNLVDHNIIGKLSLRLSNNLGNIYDGLYDDFLVLDSIEYGKPFSIENVGKFDYTKLYSDNYNEILCINSTELDITFEETVENPIIYEDAVVGQVIHLQFKKADNDKIVITHLDHEYIFYDRSSYLRKKENPKIKAEQKRRIKSFKIDSSAIPIEYCVSRSGIFCDSENIEKEFNENVPFIIFVLKCYFNNISLIDEYFSRIK